MTQNKQTSIEYLRTQLFRGDYKTLASMANVSRETVKKTLSGERNNQVVVQAARILIRSREAAKKVAEFNQQPNQ